MKSKERKGVVEKFGEVTEGSGKIDKLKKFEILERIEELRLDSGIFRYRLILWFCDFVILWFFYFFLF